MREQTGNQYILSHFFPNRLHHFVVVALHVITPLPIGNYVVLLINPLGLMSHYNCHYQSSNSAGVLITRFEIVQFPIILSVT